MMDSNTGIEAVYESLRCDRFDAIALWETVGQDTRLLSELVRIFSEEYPQMLLTIEQALTKKDAVSLSKAAHKVKGALLQLAAPKAASVAADLESCAHSVSLTNLSPLANQLRGEVESLLPLLKAMLPEAMRQHNNRMEHN